MRFLERQPQPDASCVYPEGKENIRVEIDPSFILAHRIDIENAPAMYRTFRDKHHACIKVVMKPGVAAPYHTDPPTSRHS